MTVASPDVRARTTQVAAAVARSRLTRRLAVPLLVASFAVAAPTIANLRRGGLAGAGAYDDAVYYAAATAFVHGQLPYRDFLFLHPPGIVLSLAPFALLAQLTSDPTGFLLARLAWLLIGGVCALLVWRILRPLHQGAAVLAGLFYGLFHPVVNVAHTLTLEAPENLALLAAVWIIRRQPRGRAPDWSAPLPWLVAGAAVGLSATLKVWGVIPIVLVAVWALLWFGGRRAVLVIAGSAVSCLAIYLPFFLAEPAVMWRYVVSDQVGRGRTTPVLDRLADLSGLHVQQQPEPATWLLGVALLAWLVAMALALAVPLGRVAVIGHLVLCAALLATPSWFLHYAGFAAPTGGLVVGCAFMTLQTRPPRLALRWAGFVVSALAVLAVGIVGLTARFGVPFPRTQLAGVGSVPGCITADDPIALIQLNLLSRNLDRNCRVVVDLGGYVHDQRGDGEPPSRLASPAWQRVALEYLGSGSQTVLSRRFTSGRYRSFTSDSLAVFGAWPVVAQSTGYTVRAPN